MFGSFSTVGVALGALTLWHAVLISRGETSIERHINSKETKRLAKRGKVSVRNIHIVMSEIFLSRATVQVSETALTFNTFLIAPPGLSKSL